MEYNIEELRKKYNVTPQASSTPTSTVSSTPAESNTPTDYDIDALRQKYNVGTPMSTTPTTSSATSNLNFAGDKNNPVEREQRIAQGLPVGTKGRAEPTVLGNIVRSVAKPIVSLGATAAGLKPDEVIKSNYFGDIKPVTGGYDPYSAQGLKEIVKTGVNIGTTVAGGPELKAVPSIFKGGLKEVVKQAPRLAKGGAVIGATQQAGEQLNAGNTVAQGLGNIAKGAAIGAIAEPVLGATTGLLGSSLSKGKKIATTPKVSRIADNNYQDLTSIPHTKKIKTLLENSRNKGIDIEKEIANSDILQGSVDENGTISTLRSGKVDEFYNDYVKPNEKIVRDSIEVEGKRVPLQAVKQELDNVIYRSNLMGAPETRALNEVASDIQAYARYADENGMIPLEIIHDAKVNKYENLDYLNKEQGNIGKTIARGLKEIVENNSDSVQVKELNGELSRYYDLMNYLEALDGKKVKGGRLGKYVAQGVGAMVGSHFGPFGTIAGSEIAGAIKGNQLSSKFTGTTGKTIPKSTILEKQRTNLSEDPRYVNKLLREGADNPEFTPTVRDEEFLTRQLSKEERTAAVDGLQEELEQNEVLLESVISELESLGYAGKDVARMAKTLKEGEIGDAQFAKKGSKLNKDLEELASRTGEQNFDENAEFAQRMADRYDTLQEKRRDYVNNIKGIKEQLRGLGEKTQRNITSINKVNLGKKSKALGAVATVGGASILFGKKSEAASKDPEYRAYSTTKTKENPIKGDYRNIGTKDSSLINKALEQYRKIFPDDAKNGITITPEEIKAIYMKESSAGTNSDNADPQEGYRWLTGIEQATVDSILKSTKERDKKIAPYLKNIDTPEKAFIATALLYRMKKIDTEADEKGNLKIKRILSPEETYFLYNGTGNKKNAQIFNEIMDYYSTK